jgi:hypothetical protein
MSDLGDQTPETMWLCANSMAEALPPEPDSPLRCSSRRVTGTEEMVIERSFPKTRSRRRWPSRFQGAASVASHTQRNLLLPPGYAGEIPTGG